jgi:transcriptional regulator with XRE-family HTH domain
MTTETIPVFDRQDRMAKALSHAQLTTQDMADYLGVTRETVSRWLNSRSTPNKGMMRLWAMRTGVPLAWLETGTAGLEDQAGGAMYASRDLNPEPADYRHAVAA